jgi:hypothetical protein
MALTSNTSTFLPLAEHILHYGHLISQYFYPDLVLNAFSTYYNSYLKFSQNVCTASPVGAIKFILLIIVPD